MFAAVTAWVVVVLHVAFCLMETVGWTTMGRRFGYQPEAIELTRSLALNQGFYNLGVACLLAWALITGRPGTVTALLVFVVAMALVGAVSVRWTIFVLQGLPALIALAAQMLA